MESSNPQDIRPPAAPSPRAEPRRRQVRHDLPCPECGYNLRGLHEGRCPECAGPFTIASVIEATGQAADLRFWPFYRAALLRPRRFWRGPGAGLPPSAAARFGMGCVVLAAVLAAILITGLLAYRGNWNLSSAITVWGLAFVITAVVLSIGLFALAALAGLGAIAMGRSHDGTGWRAAAGAAVWLPAWALAWAIPFANNFNVWPPPAVPSALSAAISITAFVSIACFTVIYVGIATYREKRPNPEG